MITRLFSLSFLITMTSTAALAQDLQIVDSLARLLTKKVGADRYAPRYELAFEYIDEDSLRALEIIEEAEKAALISGDSLWIVKSMRVRGQVLYKLERMDQAISLFETVIRIAERNELTREPQMIANTFGLIYVQRVQLDNALHYFFLTWELANERNDFEYIVMSLNNIGVIYYKLGDFDNALSYFFQALAIKESAATEGANVSVNISLCYSSRMEFDSASFYLRRAIRTCGNLCDAKFLMHIEFASGRIHFGKGEFTDAERDFLRSLKYSKGLHDSRMTCDNIYMLAGIYLEWNQIQKAEKCLKEGETMVASGTAFPPMLV